MANPEPTSHDSFAESLASLRARARWLLEFSTNVTSQSGEDGIILQALGRLPQRDLWCVEFGACDGKVHSNTFNLIANHNYNGVLIEADSSRYTEMVRSYPYRGRCYLVHRYVSFEGENCLDQILSQTPIPRDFDLLSIDIDGNDYHVWDSINLYAPKLVLIEYNPTIANSVVFVQPRDVKCSQGSSAAAFVHLGKLKGYELLCASSGNLLFVDRRYFDHFQIPDNDLELIRQEDAVPKLFIGYDGTIFLEGKVRGEIELPWHGLRLKQSSVQRLPWFLRRSQSSYNIVQQLLYWCSLLADDPREGIRRIREKL